MIRAYPQKSSIFPGETLVLHVSTNHPLFKVELYRQGETLILVHSTTWVKGLNSPDGPEDQEWGWPGYNIISETNWQSGAYIAMFIEGDTDGNEINPPNRATPDGRTAKALFVIKNPNPGKDTSILYKIPFFTYHAYKALSEVNLGGSLYTGASKVSFLRPGGGTGGNPYDSDIVDEYDLASPRQTFTHWDSLFIEWLEKNHQLVDYCTDLDIHENTDHFLSRYNLLLSVGHDEYWSEQMRDNVASFISNHGNVAFYSGNTCWWRVHLEDNNTAMRCDKGFLEDQWYKFNPENKLTGVSYRNGDGWWRGLREAVGYQIQHASHWVFEGTSLNDGDTFGVAECLVGYECDGCLHYEVGAFKFPTASDHTPRDFLILGIGKLSATWQDRGSENLAATMGLYVSNGIVFNAATTDWARVLSNGNSVVDQITKNVLKYLKCKSVRIDTPSLALRPTDPAIEGQKVVFLADTRSLTKTSDPKYHWSINNAKSILHKTSEIEVIMPSLPVTISVYIEDGDEYVGFGTLTFTTLTGKQTQSIEFT